MKGVAKRILILVAFGLLPIRMWLPLFLHPDIRREFGLLIVLFPALACFLMFPLALPSRNG
jgi:hypothetical protein